MIHALMIVVLVVVAAGDEIGAPAGDPLRASLLTVGLIAGLWIGQHLFVARAAGRFDATGDWRLLRRAGRVIDASRWGAAAVHALGVFVFGWLGAVRAMVGDVVAVDELVAVAPAVLYFVGSFVTGYAIERRVRESILLGAAERGQPSGLTLPGLGRFVLERTRVGVLFVLIPVAAIIAWGEITLGAWGRFDLPGGELGAAAAQLCGAVGVLALMPPVLRRVWSTRRLADGPLLARIDAMLAAHRVRVRAVLLWRTGGSIVNAVVFGLVPMLRYIVLTDGIVAAMNPEQIEAVVAHEIGHIKRRHIPWLGACVLAVLGVVGVPAGWVVVAAMPLGSMVGLSAAQVEQLAGGGVLVITLGAVLVVLGFVSRRFEWQADAFAVEHLSVHAREEGNGQWAMGNGEEKNLSASLRSAPPPSGTGEGEAVVDTGGTPVPRGGGDGEGLVVSPGAARAMGSALMRVAALGGISPERHTWRHGSIAGRVRRVRRLVGVEIDRVPADRVARGVKVLIVLGLVVAGGMLGVEVFVLGV